MTLLFIYLAIAIGVSFLCSVLEAVLLSVTPSYAENLLTERPRAGRRLGRVRQRLDESLSSILILNTFAHTMGAAGVGSQALQVFGQQWETLIAVLLTLAIPSALVISWLVKLVYPLVWLATRLTKLFSANRGDEITREEIIALASLGHKGGTLFSHENEYLSNLLSLRDVRTEAVLTPRSVVHMLNEDLPVSEALDQSATRQFTRMPIYGQDFDDIKGKVIRADLFEAERSGHGKEPIKNFAKPVIRVSEKLPVQQLLDMFIKSRAHLFLVEDEFGQTSGIVTLEDAIETLLGREILDERDTVEDMQELARQQYRQRLRDEKEKL